MVFYLGEPIISHPSDSYDPLIIIIIIIIVILGVIVIIIIIIVIIIIIIIIMIIVRVSCTEEVCIGVVTLVSSRNL